MFLVVCHCKMKKGCLSKPCENSIDKQPKCKLVNHTKTKKVGQSITPSHTLYPNPKPLCHHILTHELFDLTNILTNITYFSYHSTTHFYFYHHQKIKMRLQKWIVVVVIIPVNLMGCQEQGSDWEEVGVGWEGQFHSRPPT